MGRGGGRSGGGGRSSHSSSRGVTSGRSGGFGRSFGSGMRSAGGFSRGSSSGSTHRGGAGFGGPGKRTTSSSGNFGGSSRRSSGGYGGGYGRPTPPPPPPGPRYGGWGRSYRRGPIFVGPVYGGGGGYAGGSGGGCGGCLLTLIILLVVAAVLMYAAPSGCSSHSIGSSHTETTYQVSQVSHTHKKLAASECDVKDVWLDDRADWIDNESKVVKALKYFYDKTGTQPYLVVATDVDGETDFTDEEGEAWAHAIYDEQFDDDGHTVVAFVEYEESEYTFYIVAGRSAQSVIDDEAREIIADEINYWYTDPSLDDSEYFAKVFTESADTIMFDYEETTKTANSHRRTIVLALGAAGVALVVGIVVMRTSKRKREEYEAARQLAETPLGANAKVSSVPTPTSGSTDTAATSVSATSELEEFEKKYGSDPS